MAVDSDDKLQRMEVLLYRLLLQLRLFWVLLLSTGQKVAKVDRKGFYKR
jgi:hypothetical protein